MNPYNHQTQNYYGSRHPSRVILDPRGWIYDPMTSTGTLDCVFVFDPQPPVEYVDQVVILNTPLLTYDQRPLQYSYAQNPDVPDPRAENTFWDPLLPIPYHPLEPNYLENAFSRIEQEGSLVLGEITVDNSRGTTTTGVSEETITQRLQAAQEKTKGEEESDVCAICLDGYRGYEKMGRLECGHGYHVDCIKTWLLRKNVCPMCKATAFTM